MEFQTVTIDDLPELADSLANQIRSSGYTFDHILYIEKAGQFLGFLLHERLGGTISGVRVCRPGGRLKKIVGPLLPLLPQKVRQLLRSIELHYYGQRSEREIRSLAHLPPHIRTILIVDDAIDSGSSVLAVLRYLMDLGFQQENLRVAVVNTTVSKRLVNPDYVCYQNALVCFPWSRDSNERATYLKMTLEQGAES